MQVWRKAGRADHRTPRRNKYRAQRCQHDDHWHDSLRERDRCFVLEQRAALGDISDLRRQPRYPLLSDGMHVADYIADFEYCENGRLVVEDTKGYRTATYRLKRRLMKAVYNIDILET